MAGFAVSLDGFIEGPHGEYDWIIMDPEHFRGLSGRWEKTDAMLYGRKTYTASLALQPESKAKKKKQNNPFSHMQHYVFSNTLPAVQDGFVLVKGSLEEEVKKLKAKAGNDIAVFGGPELVSSLINADLVDELQLAVVPVVLGAGKPFFAGIRERKSFELMEAKSYSSGLVVLTYKRKGSAF